jgi:hypothetical protein
VRLPVAKNNLPRVRYTKNACKTCGEIGRVKHSSKRCERCVPVKAKVAINLDRAGWAEWQKLHDSGIPSVIVNSTLGTSMHFSNIAAKAGLIVKKSRSEAAKVMIERNPEMNVFRRMGKTLKSGPSYPQRLAHAWFTKLGEPFEHEKPFGRFNADFYLPGRKLIVEIDGDIWHSSEKDKAYDENRDREILSRFGVEVTEIKRVRVKGLVLSLNSIFNTNIYVDGDPGEPPKKKKKEKKGQYRPPLKYTKEFLVGVIIKHGNFTKAGVELGVSANAVKKHLVKHGICYTINSANHGNEVTVV